MIILHAPDCLPTSAQHPHGVETMAVFARFLTTTEGRLLPIDNTLLGNSNVVGIAIFLRIAGNRKAASFYALEVAWN